VPVTITFLVWSRAAACGKPTKARVVIHESQRFARPGIAFDSCKKVRAPHRRAAKRGGALVKPPMAKAACGGRGRKSSLEARYDLAKAEKNAHARPRVSPTAGSVWTSNSGACRIPCWSTSLAEMSRMTSQPRRASCPATASPGKRCPPVPPQASAILGPLGWGRFMPAL
jgi:hypothetical protein